VIPEPAPGIGDRYKLGDASAAALILAHDPADLPAASLARAACSVAIQHPIRADQAVSAGTAARRDRVRERGTAARRERVRERGHRRSP
jgi:hypothetical protein